MDWGCAFLCLGVFWLGTFAGIVVMAVMRAGSDDIRD